jgi:hypothetical protein
MSLDVLGEGRSLCSTFIVYIGDEQCFRNSVAFDHHFGVLNNNGVDNELVQAFNNLLHVL